MNILYTLTCFVWLASEILLGRLMHSGEGDKKNTDRKTLSFIWILIAIAIAASVIISKNISAPIIASDDMMYIGACIILIGMLFRFSVIKSLGRFFTVDVTIRQDHSLKTTGYYKYIRHPSYLASYISFLGYGLSLNNYISLLAVAILLLIAFNRRIVVEEALLEEQFGNVYRDYKRKTKKIIPFVF